MSLSKNALDTCPPGVRGEFKTFHVDSFVQYVKQHARPGESAGFIGDEYTATVIFDLGNTSSHTARLKLEQTTPFVALHQVIDTNLTQQKLSEWLEDWAPHVSIYRDNDEIPLYQAIYDIYTVCHPRIETKGERESESGDPNAKRIFRFPEHVLFTCKPYDALEEVTFRLRLSVVIKDERILRLNWVDARRQKEMMIDNFRTLLTARLKGTVPLIIGNFSHEQPDSDLF